MTDLLNGRKIMYTVNGSKILSSLPSTHPQYSPINEMSPLRFKHGQLNDITKFVFFITKITALKFSTLVSLPSSPNPSTHPGPAMVLFSIRSDVAPQLSVQVEAKSEGKSDKKESRDPRSRDPRRKNKTDDKKDGKTDKKQDVVAPAPPIIRDETVKSSKDKKDRSPSRKSSSHKKSSSGSSKSSKSSSHSSSKNTSSSSSKSSSNSSSRSKEEKENAAVKTEKLESNSRKRTRDAEVSLSPSPTGEGRISPLPAPPLGRIPKVSRTSGTGGSFGDSLTSMDTQESDKKRGNKRPGSGKVSPLPDKRTKSLFIE